MMHLHPDCMYLRDDANRPCLIGLACHLNPCINGKRPPVPCRKVVALADGFLNLLVATSTRSYIDIPCRVFVKARKDGMMRYSLRPILRRFDSTGQ